jgi:hypothetical protein
MQIKLIQLINELNVTNPNMPKVYESDKCDLIKIINTGPLPLIKNYDIGDGDGNVVDEEKYLEKYPNLYYILNCINFAYQGNIDSLDDTISSIDIVGNFPSKLGYASVGGDGGIYLTDTLKNFNPRFQTEEEWNVQEWKLITI